jgi:hypothetical protein
MAARNGAEVTVLEQNEKPGKKICATGNGKCNLTNLETPEDAYRGTHPEFVCNALNTFTVTDTIAFFLEIGIYPVDRNGYLYPHSNQASSVVDVLCMEARSLGVKIKTNTKVTSVRPGRNGGWMILVDGWSYEGDAVILANGSKASSIAGSDGSGYELASELGHTIVPPLPALTALKCKGNFFSVWAGVRVEAEVTLYLDGCPKKRERGEIHLTEYGVSGIPVFQLSRYAIHAMARNRKVVLHIDLLPELSRAEVRELLSVRAKNCPYKGMKELLIGLFPEKLGKVLCGFVSQKVMDLAGMAAIIKDFELPVTDSLSYAQSQVCQGGVDTKLVDSNTMESKLCPGLYFAGELLDIDGTCGGYNLQWAWTSGAVAGIHASKKEVFE